MTIVVKIGTSSLTDVHGAVNPAAVTKLAAEVAALRRRGRRVVIVTSAAVAAGLAPLGFATGVRPRDTNLLRAASAVGQITLMATYRDALAAEGLVAGQVLLAPTDFWYRNRYLKSRGTIQALLERGAVPVINENDAVADDEIRFGDNDRLAALVAHLIDAERLVLLTDTPGLFTADPRIDESASLIEEIVEFDQRFEAMAGGPGSSASRGGMASKLAAAKIATWSGVETIIASSDRPDVLADAVNGIVGVGTVFRRRQTRLPARKLWIAFALPSSGRIVVDDGARTALEERQRSLLAAGVKTVDGAFGPDDAVEIADGHGEVFAKGLTRWGSDDLVAHAGKRTAELPEDLVDEVVHRDDLIVLPT
ncbi:MAG: glutamate 5-kinase [Acidimicrobiales bacterium]